MNQGVEIVDRRRHCLTDISWYMRVSKESIARQANWEVRLKSQSLLDDAAIRAGIAETPEDRDLTSIPERLRQFAELQQFATPESPDPIVHLVGS